MKKTLLIIIVLLGFSTLVWFTQRNNGAPVATATPTPTSTDVPNELIPTMTTTIQPSASPSATPAPATHTVTYTNNGYSPATLTVKKGDTVVFENKSSRKMWTASDVHPTHRNYPGSGIEKCSSAGADIFDACRGFDPGENYSFTFNQVGTWQYHNHSQANHGGTVIVQ